MSFQAYLIIYEFDYWFKQLNNRIQQSMLHYFVDVQYWKFTNDSAGERIMKIC